MRKRKIFVLILISLVLLILTGCSKNNTENLELQKSISETKFLENHSITMFTKYISDEYLENGQINWKIIEDDFMVLSSSIDIIFIDFANINIPSQIIVDLENHFNDLKVFLQNRDLNSFMGKICDVYNLVSNTILNSVSNDDIFKSEKRIKGELVYIGYYLKTANKDEVMKHLDNFQNGINVLNSNKEYIENNSYKINRIFMKIQQLKLIIAEDNLKEGENLIIELFEFF